MSRTAMVLCATVMALLAQTASAWWNPEWSQRRKITLDASASGVPITENATSIPIAVRLHTGNFSFADAKEDGSDLRFVAADDKTPLKHHVEKFDGINELAVVWVQVPRIAAGAKETLWLYFGNPKAASAEDAKGTYDSSQTLVLHLAETQGEPRDASAYGHHPVRSTGRGGTTGWAAGGMAFDGSARIEIAGTEALRIKAVGGMSFSAWVKSADAAQSGVLFAQREDKRALMLRVDGGRLLARMTTGGAAIEARGPELPAGAWHHVGLTVADRIVLYLDGREVATAAVKPQELGGAIGIGGADGEPGFRGDIDEAQLAGAARGPAWFALAHAQGADAKLLAFGENEAAEAGGGSSSYFHILLGAVTLDGWIVIGILIVMLIVSFAIMIGKALVVARTDRANQAFLEGFKALSADMTALSGDEDARRLGASSLFRLYRLGIVELRRRFRVADQGEASASLSPQSINAIRASMDAGLVRESHRLNSQMVLLTIAISGGPFLGLLGTVVGVMITFAAIAAVGDVNVNSIAPGIAAALVATVAGLAVAIPALFGYNYLASRIKSITADMQVFADEFVAKIAENYSR